MKQLVLAAAVAAFALSSFAASPVGRTTATAASKPATAAAVPATVPAVETISHGKFENLRVHRPIGTPTAFVLFLSGDGGWTSRDRGGAQAMVDTLVADGAMVVAIDTPRLLSAFEADGGDCVYPVGDFENLSHFVQAWAHLPTYLTPILAGHAAGATLAYGVLAQAEKGSFTGATTTAFCPDLNLAKPFCAGNGAVQAAPDRASDGIQFLPTRSLTAPWVSLHGEIDQVCPISTVSRFMKDMPNARLIPVPKVGHAFSTVTDWRAAYRDAIAGLETTQSHDSLPPPPGALNDLPVIEVEAGTARGALAETFAVLVSGDGGWAGIDKELAAHLAAAGMPVVGVDSLRYFWAERTPEGFASDLERIIRHYRQKLERPRVLLIGYSQGADVLPFALNRLPAATRNDLALVVLLGLAERAQFEFHLSSWVGSSSGGLPTRPEVARLQSVASNPPLLCVWGEEDEDAICGTLTGPRLTTLKLPGGHHFDGDYEALARKLLAAIPAARVVKR